MSMSQTQFILIVPRLVAYYYVYHIHNIHKAHFISKKNLNDQHTIDISKPYYWIRCRVLKEWMQELVQSFLNNNLYYIHIAQTYAYKCVICAYIQIYICIYVYTNVYACKFIYINLNHYFNFYLPLSDLLSVCLGLIIFFIFIRWELSHSRLVIHVLYDLEWL